MTVDCKEINQSEKSTNLLYTNCPNASGRIVTEPLNASSKTAEDTVVLIKLKSQYIRK